MIEIKKKSLLYNAFILTCANILVRILGFIYKIILSRKIGPQAIGLFQLVFPIYMLIITLTTSGIPIAISRIVAEHNAKKDTFNMLYSMKIITIVVSIISFILSLAFALNASFISNSILRDPKSYPVIIAIFPCIFIVSVSSVHRGFFYGIHDVVPPASGEVIEQLTRIALVMSVLYFLPPLKIEYAASLAALGMVIGELFGLLVLRTKYKTYISDFCKKISVSIRDSKNLLKRLFSISIPITITRIVSSLIQALNIILIPQRLQLAGYTSNQAISQFGKLTGMAMPIVFLPFTVTSALAVIIIPNLSESLELKDWEAIKTKTSKATLLTSLVGFLVFSLIFSFSKDLGEVIFAQKNVGEMIFYMSFSIPFLCIYHNFSSILNGIGKQKIVTLNFIIGAAIQLFCTYFLVSNPYFKINGFILGFTLDSAVSMTLNGIWVYKITKTKIKTINWLIKPFLCTLPAIYSINNIYPILKNTKINILLAMAICCVIGTVFFSATAYILKIMPKIKDFKR